MLCLKQCRIGRYNISFKKLKDMSVIKNVAEKVKSVIDILPEGYSEDDFYAKFIEMYPDDYEKCKKKFLAEERKTKPGRSHPMQKTEKLLRKL